MTTKPWQYRAELRRQWREYNAKTAKPILWEEWSLRNNEAALMVSRLAKENDQQ